MPRYVYFLLACAALLVGYFVYGKIVTKIFGADNNRPTPAVSMADGVDYVPMSPTKIWLIQLLNIAGIADLFSDLFSAHCMVLQLCFGLLSAVFLQELFMTICPVCFLSVTKEQTFQIL